MRALALTLLLSAGCIDFSLGQGSKGADGGASASSSSGSDAATDAGPAGLGCGQDPNTGATLCLGISSCPGLTVDTQAYPGCGFRVSGGNAIDLECACNDYVCPLGVATTCAQASKLMADQSQALVCAQIGEGRCTMGTPVTQPPASTCDKVCQSECGGDPNCIRACGC